MNECFIRISNSLKLKNGTALVEMVNHREDLPFNIQCRSLMERSIYM